MSSKTYRFFLKFCQGIAALALAGGAWGADYGLDSAQPIGAYLDGKFPTQAPGNSGGWTTERIFPGIAPGIVTCAIPYPGTNKIVLVEKQGRVLTFENTPAATTMDVLLDLRTKTFNSGDAGMSQMAFHPEFGAVGSPNRGYIYVTYKYSPDDDAGEYSYWRLSRFTVPDGSTEADPNSELVLMQFFDRHNFHDAGCLLFGTDGYLYVTVGDEGVGNDFFNVTQKIDDRPFSGVLRIDVDQRLDRGHAIRRQPRQIAETPAGWPASFTANYTIPNDNPWVREDGSVLEEFYAIGLRSPWAMSRDSFTGRIWIGDVGEGSREEVDELAKGANFEWAYREGTLPGPKPQPTNLIGTSTPPVWEYGRSDGFCIILGPFYRGSAHPGLQGKCLVGDFGSGNVWALAAPQAGDPATPQLLLTMNTPGGGTQGLTTFLELPNGEVVLLKFNEQFVTEFYRLARTGTPLPEPPALLSQTGAFTDLTSLTPRNGLTPYTVNSPLWSDGAQKKRWIAIPNDGTPDSPAEKIRFAPESEWIFPAGTVFVKHFELPVSETNPARVRRLETRFLVIAQSGNAYGVTYRWRPDGSDADLLTDAATESISIAEAGGGTRQQAWNYPSRSNCLTCHNAAAHHVLGVKTHQLNGDLLYLQTGRTANQLSTWNHIGFFDAAYRPEHLRYFLKSTTVGNLSAPLETRVRSYLDANCAQCHRPGGVRANFDARFTTSLSDQKLLRGRVESSFTGAKEEVVMPGDAAHSAAFLRASAVGPGQMPPIAKNVIDTEAVQTIQQWIASLNQGPGVELTSQGYGSNGDARVGVTFTEAVEGFDILDPRVRGGTIASLEGSGANYTLHVHFASAIGATIDVPAGAASGNHGSAKLSVMPQTPNLMAWLRFDGDLKNGVNASAPGAISGSSQWIDGAIDKGIQLSGGQINLLNKFTDDFTISFWIRRDQPFPTTETPAQGSTLMFSDAPNTAEDILISGTYGGGMNRVILQTGGQASGNLVTVQGDIPIEMGAWTHVAVTRVKSTHALGLYVNGVQDALVFGGAEDFSLSSLLQIGGASDGVHQPFLGGLDQLRIYDRAMTETEVAALAGEAAAGPPSPIAAWFEDTMPGLLHLQDLDLDPDGDGRTNFDEYAFAGDPLAEETSLVRLADSGQGLGITYPVRPASRGLTYEVQVSFDLQTWQSAGSRMHFGADVPGPDAGLLMRAGFFEPLSSDPQNAAFLRVVPRGEPR